MQSCSLLVNRRSSMAALVIGIFGFCLSASPLAASDQQYEEQLIEILETTTATLQEKDAACAQLKRIGTAHSVPALSALLTDNDLSHSARYALESMPGPEAGQALAIAVDETTGLVQAGLLQSLVSREEGPVDKIIPLLSAPDPDVATAAAACLGSIATERAVSTLSAELSKNNGGELRKAVEDALLSAAYRLLESGSREEASAIFQKITNASPTDHMQAAAFVGIVASAPDGRALKLVTDALQDEREWKRCAALQVAREIKVPDATEAFCEIASTSVDASMQAALIELLHQRGDVNAVPTLIALTSSPHSAVRLAAYRGLGDLAGGDAVEPLARAAISSDDAESKAATHALIILRRGDENDALISQLADGSRQMKRLVTRVLIARGDSRVVDRLLALAREGNDAAHQALGRLAQMEHLSALIELVINAKDPGATAEAAQALQRLSARLKSSNSPVDTAPIVAAYRNGDVPVRIALLPTAATIADGELRNILRDATSASEPGLREAAIKALLDASSPELLSDQLEFAKEADDPVLRIQAVRGYLQTAIDPGKSGLTADQRVEALGRIAPLVERPEEKWALLGALGETTSTDALKMALPMLNDPACRAEAIQAVTEIASAIHAEYPEAAREAVAQVLAVATDPIQREAATTVRDQISTSTGTTALSKD